MRSTLVPERTVRTRSAEETRDLAARLAAVARPGDVIGLRGALGAGKTQFAAGFGRGLGVTETINSPSFVLMAEYVGREPLFHVDLYRLAGPAEILASGLLDVRLGEGITVIEWAERLGGLFAATWLDVAIEGSGAEPRAIRIRAPGSGYARYLEGAQIP